MRTVEWHVAWCLAYQLHIANASWIRIWSSSVGCNRLHGLYRNIKSSSDVGSATLNKPQNPATCLHFSQGRREGSTLSVLRKMVVLFPLYLGGSMSHLITFCFAKLRRAFRESQNPRKIQNKKQKPFFCIISTAFYTLSCSSCSAFCWPTWSPPEKQSRMGPGGWWWQGKCHVIFPSKPWMVKQLALSSRTALSPSLFQTGSSGVSYLSYGNWKPCLSAQNRQSGGGADALFGFDYLGPLQNHLERDAVGKW